MTVSLRRLMAATLVVALAQTGVLGLMILDRVTILRSGREIVLPVVPIDPRSLFQGDYVALTYAISRLEVPAGLAAAPLVPGTAVYVRLARQPDGLWVSAGLAASYPAEARPDEVVLLGRVRSASPAGGPGTIWVDYGIESYFVPEGTGLDLEATARESRLAVVAAVDRHGRAAIKGLRVDGRAVYDEPLL